MNLTELDESLIYFLCILSSIVIIILSWLSTNVREFVLPGNLLVIERHSRRLYTASVNGNINRIQPHQLSSTLIATTSNSNVTSTLNQQANTETTASEPYLSSQQTTRNNQIDLVDEMVEQALVDNLLDGTYYSTNPIDLVNRNNGTNSNQSNSTVNSTSEVTNVIESNVINSNEENTNSNSASNAEETDDGSGLLINILIKFVNEKEMKIQARPNDTIMLLKRTHFATELDNNKIVRFIYQGQFLCDKNTIKSYNIKDKTTIHCHITSKQPTSSNSTSMITANDYSTSNIRQRINSHQINSITRLTGGLNQNENESVNLDGANSNLTNMLPETPVSSRTVSSTTNNQTTMNNTNSIRVPMNRRSRRLNNHANMINTATIINVDLANIFLPFFAVLLGSFWYIRVHFKHFFTPFSTLVLFLISFIYALFLFNNIYTSSFVEANANQLIMNRLFSRRSQQQQQQQHQQLQQNQMHHAQPVS